MNEAQLVDYLMSIYFLLRGVLLDDRCGMAILRLMTSGGKPLLK